jgi:ABC-type nitrate/sulfonate/bicarbonate transport system permease component
MKTAADEQEIYASQAERLAKQRYRRRVMMGQFALIVVVIAVWHFGSGRLFDPFFVGNPVAVARVLIDGYALRWRAEMAATIQVY